MNYIEIMNHYWQLREQGILTANEGDLYLYLINKSNQLKWKNPFNQSNRLICAVLAISEKSLIKYRNSLKQIGLIDFESGKATKQNTNYCIFFRGSGSGLGSSSGSSSGSGLVQNRSDNNKHIPNKRKEGNSEAVASGEPKTPYWKNFVGIWFEVYQHTTGAKPSFRPADAKNLQSIVTRLKKMTTEIGQEWTEDRAERVFRRFLSNALRDDWLKANFLLTSLSTKFDAIVNQPKDGTKTGPSSSTYKPGTIDTEKLVGELTHDLENGNIPGQFS